MVNLVDVDDEELVNGNFTDALDSIVVFHTINIALGSLSSVVDILLIFVFLQSTELRRKYQLLITLAFADLTTCIAITTMGINRRHLYRSVIESKRIPINTSWSCALQAWLWLRIIGDLWSPAMQMIIAVERWFAVYRSSCYKFYLKNRSRLPIIGASLVFVFASLLSGLMIAYYNRETKVTYYCGRKNAFTPAYGTYVYVFIIFGYMFGFILNISTFIGAKRAAKSREMLRQIDRIRYLLIISLISVILVSIPNLVSLTSVWILPIADSIARPSVWASCVNASINLFVYLCFNSEYRIEFCKVFHLFRNNKQYELPQLQQLQEFDDVVQ